MGLGQVDAAIETWFRDVEADAGRRFDPDALATATGPQGLTPDRVRRLMLNDHRSPLWPPAGFDPDAVPGPPQAHPYDRCNPMKPMDLIRPLVLRARAGDTVEVTLHNRLSNRDVGLHVQGSGQAGGPGPGGPIGPVIDGVQGGDGSHIGANPASLAGPGGTWHYRWRADQEGVWPINDLADVRGTEAGTNIHGLFGALIVEPPRTWWRDPETGEPLINTRWADGLYVDIVPFDEDTGAEGHHDFVDFHLPGPGGAVVPRSHREYAIFIHDEPEVHSALHFGEHTVMPLSYRAEPMENRLPHRMRRYAQRTASVPDPGQVGGGPARRGDRHRRRPHGGVPGGPDPRRPVAGAGGRRGAAPQLVAVRRSCHPPPAGLPGRPGPHPPGPRRGQGDPRLPPPRPPVAGRSPGHGPTLGVAARASQGIAAARLDHHRPPDGGDDRSRSTAPAAASTPSAT